jgi:trimeric autotransporter adhesin
LKWPDDEVRLASSISSLAGKETIMRVLPVTVLVSICVNVFATAAQAQCTVDWISGGGIPGTDGTVRALHFDSSNPRDPILYVGGQFRIAGNAFALNVARFQNEQWTAVGGGVIGQLSQVRAIVMHDGMLIAAGTSSNSNTTVFRWNGTQWSNINLGLLGSVHALVLYEGELIAAGSFNSHQRVARWTGSGWSALGTGVPGTVNALCVHKGLLYAGGTFTTVGGNTALRVAKWDGATWSAVSPFGPNSEVNAFASYGDYLAVGGSFSTIDGVPFNRVALFDGANWMPLGDGVSGSAVNCLSAADGSLFVGGTITLAGGHRVANVARWDGAAWNGLESGLSGTALAMAHVGTNMVIGGNFSRAGSTYSSMVARWNGAFSPLGEGSFNLDTSVFHEHMGNLYAGGPFRYFKQYVLNGIARWDDLEQAWVPVGVLTGHTVSALGSYGDRIVVGGRADTSQGTTSLRVSVFDGSNWNALGTFAGPVGAIVSALVTYQGDLICGGTFTTADGQAASNIARWNGTNWSPMGNGLDDSVTKLAIFNNELIAAGRFANHIRRWDGAEWVPLGGGLNNIVVTLLVANNELYAGGQFTNPGPGGGSYVARWNGVSWSYIGRDDIPGITGLGFHRGELYAGSLAILFETNPFIYRRVGNTWLPIAESTSAAFRPFASHGKHLFIGGGFLEVNNQVSPHWIRYGPSCRSADLNCDGSVDGMDLARLARGLILNNFSECEALVGDFTGDDAITETDIAGFVDCVLLSGCP